MSSSREEALCRRISIATFFMWACLLATIGPVVYAIWRIMAVSQKPDGGLEGLAIVLGCVPWAPVLLFPLLGFRQALEWRRGLEAELRKIKSA